MTRGIQEGNDTRYVKLLGALKHFTAYSMEHSDGSDRMGFSPTISKHDMADSYLPAYRIGITEGKSLGMMCSYTTVNQTAMCESAVAAAVGTATRFPGQHCDRLHCIEHACAITGLMDAAQCEKLAGTDLNCGNGWDGKSHGYTAAAAAVRAALPLCSSWIRWRSSRP